MNVSFANNHNKNKKLILFAFILYLPDGDFQFTRLALSLHINKLRLGNKNKKLILFAFILYFTRLALSLHRKQDL